MSEQEMIARLLCEQAGDDFDAFGKYWPETHYASAAAAIVTTLASQTPEGMVMVPREPTEAMIKAGVEGMWPGPEAVYPDEHEGVEAAIRAVWSAMLAASPTPSPEGAE
ncbi:MAG: hypothetical protein EON59_03985 [Alphaproteobacteria bacterium]|nr:MAG: hypothetical protein EON59_03985 [Alphaproteobacteria bacterium]